MYSRIIKPPQKTSFFLFGPRGVGKTTWIKENFAQDLYFDLLKAETYNHFITNPTRLEKMIPPDYQRWVIIDEIQKIPALLDEVHRLIEEKKLKFILTGSSARKLRRGGVNLLAGRALTYYLHPLTAVELGNDFSFQTGLKFGALPQVFSAENKHKYLQSYIQTYLQQEVLQERITRNLGAFSRFLEIASFSQGSILNMSAVAREASVGRRMAEDYFTALKDLLISIDLPPFTKKAKRKLMRKDKFYLFDSGVYQALRPTGPFDYPQEIGGMAFETLFLQNLRALNDYLNLGYKIYYWKTVSGVEVDFVIYGEKGIKAFELKSKTKVTKKDFRGLKTFLKDYPQAKGYLLYGGDKKEYHQGIKVLPAEAALKGLPKVLDLRVN